MKRLLDKMYRYSVRTIFREKKIVLHSLFWTPYVCGFAGIIVSYKLRAKGAFIKFYFIFNNLSCRLPPRRV